jgi:hypothetical protein
MDFEQETSPLELLWQEYGRGMRDWDDLTLARWLSQTLSQLEGRVWRFSHPLAVVYRLGAQIGHERAIWQKRLATMPGTYVESPCCHSPALPLLTRDVRESGLVCLHCSETLAPFDEIPADIRGDLQDWAQQYEPVHAVAHWDDRQRRRAGSYDTAFEGAAQQAEKFLAQAGKDLAPRLLNHYPAAIWEDQDECLEVRPEDVSLKNDGQ